MTMFNKIKFAYLEHEFNVNFLKQTKTVKYLYEGIKSLFHLLIILILVVSTLLLLISPIFTVFVLFSLVCLIPLYYNCIKLLVYTITWISENSEKVSSTTNLKRYLN